MYQDIDETDQEELTEPRFPRWVWGLAALLALAAGVLFFISQNTAADAPRPSEQHKVERASYRAAITEPSAAMRRARLTDFLSTYPDSDRTASAEALLRVLSAGEADDWAALTETTFDPKLSREEKLAALDQYEPNWGASLLGGRGDGITTLREELTADIKKFPSRKMKDDKTSVPDTINDTVMVGGPNQIVLNAPINGPIIGDVVEIDRGSSKNIVPPKLRKPSNPAYPRKAYRAKVGALVTVSLDIDEKGRVKRVHIVEVEAKAYKNDFAKASRKAAKKSRYYPKTIDGKAVTASGHVKRYRFTPE